MKITNILATIQQKLVLSLISYAITKAVNGVRTNDVFYYEKTAPLLRKENYNSIRICIFKINYILYCNVNNINKYRDIILKDELMIDENSIREGTLILWLH